jgi:transcription elongation factor/antiterminator RfaH
MTTFTHTPVLAQDAWYVVHCQPLKERYAALLLHEQYGATTYFPTIIRHFRGRVQDVSLFPRYLFVRTNLQTVSVSDINTTPGVVRLVTFEDHPQPLADATIKALHQQVEQINEQGGLDYMHVEPGDSVRIVSGPLAGLEGIFVGPTSPSRRVRILLEFMGRLNNIDIDRDDIQADQGEQPPKRPRRTRGKGRVITP